MSRVSRARKIAAAAAYGGGGLGVLGAIAAGLIVSQINYAYRTIKPPEGPAPTCDGVYGPDGTVQPGTPQSSSSSEETPLRLVVLGDSSAVGLGVERSDQTPGAVLARNLARIAGRPVQLCCYAVVGALSADLRGQVDKALEVQPDLALIMIGGNDVTHRVWPSVAVRHLAEAVRTLRGTGCDVVVGTCPDLGTVQPIRPPLRWLARRWSRELAAAQTIAVVEAGGRTVSLGDLLGPEFAKAPDRLFSADQFHPSAAGYAAVAAALLPTFAVTLSLREGESLPEGEPTRRPTHRSGVSSLPQAAVEAAYHAGTEVSGTEVAGSERGPSGRWAQLRQWVLAWNPWQADHDPANASHSTATPETAKAEAVASIDAHSQAVSGRCES